jgi:16S rRNA (cytosine967-C5)-methyltransferase
VVARALKKDKRWGVLIEKICRETIYEIVRWKRLYGEIAEVKEPLTETIFGECFQYGPYSGYPILIGDN